MKGVALQVEGPELRVGDSAPAFKLQQMGEEGLREVTLADYVGKTLILSVVPSLDTRVCAAMTKRFSNEAEGLPDSVRVLTVSTDLPFALRRFCGAEGIGRVEAASDHLTVSFGKAYGVLIPTLRLLARAVFVVGRDGVLVYVEYVPELTEEPDYGTVVSAAQEVAG